MELIKDLGIPIYWEGGEMSAVLNKRLRVEYSVCLRVSKVTDWICLEGLIAWLNAGDWRESRTDDGADILIYLHCAKRAHLMAIALSQVVLRVYTKDGDGVWS